MYGKERGITINKIVLSCDLSPPSGGGIRLVDSGALRWVFRGKRNVKSPYTFTRISANHISRPFTVATVGLSLGKNKRDKGNHLSPVLPHPCHRYLNNKSALASAPSHISESSPRPH